MQLNSGAKPLRSKCFCRGDTRPLPVAKRCLQPRARSARRGYCRPTGNVRQPDPALPDVVSCLAPERASRGAAAKLPPAPISNVKMGRNVRQTRRPMRGSNLIRFSPSEGCPLVRFSSKGTSKIRCCARRAIRAW